MKLKTLIKLRPSSSAKRLYFRSFGGVFLLAMTVLLSATANGQQPPSSPAATPAAEAAKPAAAPVPVIPKVLPLADKLLTQTCEALGSSDAFSFHAEVLFDQVLPSAVKVQYAGAIDFAVQRPDELSIDFHSDLGAKELWYQKDTLTFFDPVHAVYATLTTPDSIDEMLDQVAATHKLRLPLSNLAYADPCFRMKQQIIFGTFVGVNDVNGEACNHLAFSSATIDLQLWLARTGKPVPRKLVINYRTEPGSPEFIAVLSDWKFPQHIPDERFRSKVPKHAVRIEFLKVKETQQ
jgi:hypothetical protein